MERKEAGAALAVMGRECFSVQAAVSDLISSPPSESTKSWKPLGFDCRGTARAGPNQETLEACAGGF